MINGKINNVPYHPLPWDIPEDTGDVILNEDGAYVTKGELEDMVNSIIADTVGDIVTDAISDAIGDISMRDNGDGTYTLVIGDKEAGTIVVPADKYLTDVHYDNNNNIVFVVKDEDGNENDIVLDASSLIDNNDDGVFDLGDIDDPTDDTFER